MHFHDKIKEFFSAVKTLIESRDFVRSTRSSTDLVCIYQLLHKKVILVL